MRLDRLLLTAMILAGAAPASAAEPECLKPAAEALNAGRFIDAIRLAEARLGEARCAPVIVHLRMTRAMALLDRARAEGGLRWCESLAAFEPMRDTAGPDYGPVVRDGLAESQRRCKATESIDWASGPMVLMLSGAGVTLVGGGLITAGWLIIDGADTRSAVTYTREGAIYLVGDLDYGEGLALGGWIVVGVGLSAIAGGALWRWLGDDSGGVQVQVGPGGIGLTGAF